MNEHRAGSPRFNELRQTSRSHPIEQVGEQLRSMMPWLAENRLVDKSRN